MIASKVEKYGAIFATCKHLNASHYSANRRVKSVRYKFIRIAFAAAAAVVCHIARVYTEGNLHVNFM